MEVFYQVLSGQGFSSLFLAAVPGAYMQHSLKQRPDLAVLFLFQAFFQNGLVFITVPLGQHPDGDFPLRGLFGGKELTDVLLPAFLAIKDPEQLLFHRLGAVLGKAQNFCPVLLGRLPQNRTPQAASRAGGFPEAGYGLFPSVLQISFEDFSGRILQLLFPSVQVQRVIGISIAVELPPYA